MKTIGVIGLGSIGMRHALNLEALGQKVIGYDPDEDIKEFNDASPETIYDRCDAVVIASPTACHYEHLVACANAGVPCFVEKPVADQWIDVNAVMVGYNLRFHSCVKKAKEWINEDAFGEHLWGNFTVAQFSSKPDYLRDGVILNWSHEIDLALYLLGPSQVKSCIANDDESLADIILANGCQSVIHLDYLTKPEIRQSMIVGSKARVIMDLVNRQAWLQASNGDMIDHHEGDDTFEENYQEEMQAFLDRLDGNTTLGCTGEEGLEVLKVCLEAKKLSQ